MSEKQLIIPSYKNLICSDFEQRFVVLINHKSDREAFVGQIASILNSHCTVFWEDGDGYHIPDFSLEGKQSGGGEYSIIGIFDDTIINKKEAEELLDKSGWDINSIMKNQNEENIETILPKNILNFYNSCKEDIIGNSFVLNFIEKFIIPIFDKIYRKKLNYSGHFYFNVYHVKNKEKIIEFSYSFEKPKENKDYSMRFSVYIEDEVVKEKKLIMQINKYSSLLQEDTHYGKSFNFYSNAIFEKIKEWK